MASEKRLIDANEAIERARYSDNLVGSSIWEAIEVVEFLEDCPTIDAVEVVHGRWIDGFFKNTVECSVCFEKAVHHCYTEKSNYCPNCGAKMDGDGND